MKAKPKYLTEAHRKNSEAAIEYLNNQSNRSINYEEELNRHKQMHKTQMESIEKKN